MADIANSTGYDPQDLLVTSVAGTHFIGADRRPSRSDFTLTIRALRDGVSSYWLAYSNGRRTKSRLVPRDGTVAGRVLVERSDLQLDGIMATEIIFSEPLRRGETGRVGFTMINSYAESDVKLPPSYCRLTISDPGCREIGMRLVFDHRPRRLDRCAWRSGTEPDDPAEQDVDQLDGDGSASFRIALPSPGSYGWRWTWPAADEVDVVLPRPPG